MLTRRAVLQGLGAAGLLGTGVLGAGALRGAPERRAAAGADGELPWSGLARSLREERVYAPRVEGRLPEALRGTLYRNGPGLFERGSERKHSVLDGDGMVQAFRFGADGVEYRNRFVRTDKFLDEEKSGEYEYATWTTRAPGGMFANMLGSGVHVKGQAGVTVVERNGRVFAFDESTQPWEVHPETLETIGFDHLGLEEGLAVHAAHTKVDPRNGDWILFGVEYGRQATLHVTVIGKDGALRSHRTVPMPHYGYVHDFFVTERHVVLHINPVEVGLAAFLSGRKSLTDSFRWTPTLGTQWLVLEREGRAPPVRFETDASWMWHALNAYERGGEIVAEYVAYRNPDHFIGADPATKALMEGRDGEHVHPGELRRVVLNLADGKAREEVLDRAGFEFPVVSPAVACHPHRYGYMVTESSEGWAWSGVARADMRTGKLERHEFPAGQFAGEAVFAPDPSRAADLEAGREPGWLLSEVYDASTQRSFLAVLDAEQVADGPVARVMLEHHVPLSFHGWWAPRA